MEKPKIYVITLESAFERQKNISDQLDKLGIEYSFYKGTNGRVEKTEINAFYNDKLRILSKGSSLKNTELGCFSSHYGLWVQCFITGKPIIVLEDDVTVSSEFSNFIKKANSISSFLECVRLFENKTKNHKFKSVVSGSMEFNIYSKGPMSAMGYYLTPEGARKFLKHIHPLYTAVDIYMDMHWRHGVASAGLSRPLVKHEYLFDSEICNDRSVKIKRNLFVKVRREIFNLFLYIKRETSFRVWIKRISNENI